MKTVVFSMVGGVGWVVEVVWRPLRGERLKWWEVMSKEQSKAAVTRVEMRGMRGRETRGREGSIARISSLGRDVWQDNMRVIKIARMTKIEDRKLDDSAGCPRKFQPAAVRNSHALFKSGAADDCLYGFDLYSFLSCDC